VVGARSVSHDELCRARTVREHDGSVQRREASVVARREETANASRSRARRHRIVVVVGVVVGAVAGAIVIRFVVDFISGIVVGVVAVALRLVVPLVCVCISPKSANVKHSTATTKKSNATLPLFGSFPIVNARHSACCSCYSCCSCCSCYSSSKRFFSFTWAH